MLSNGIFRSRLLPSLRPCCYGDVCSRSSRQLQIVSKWRREREIQRAREGHATRREEMEEMWKREEGQSVSTGDKINAVPGYLIQCNNCNSFLRINFLTFFFCLYFWVRSKDNKARNIGRDGTWIKGNLHFIVKKLYEITKIIKILMLQTCIARRQGLI